MLLWARLVALSVIKVAWYISFNRLYFQLKLCQNLTSWAKIPHARWLFLASYIWSISARLFQAFLTMRESWSVHIIGWEKRGQWLIFSFNGSNTLCFAIMPWNLAGRSILGVFHFGCWKYLPKFGHVIHKSIWNNNLYKLSMDLLELCS